MASIIMHTLCVFVYFMVYFMTESKRFGKSLPTDTDFFRYHFLARCTCFHWSVYPFHVDLFFVALSLATLFKWYDFDFQLSASNLHVTWQTLKKLQELNDTASVRQACFFAMVTYGLTFHYVSARSAFANSKIEWIHVQYSSGANDLFLCRDHQIESVTRIMFHLQWRLLAKDAIENNTT